MYGEKSLEAGVKGFINSILTKMTVTIILVLFGIFGFTANYLHRVQKERALEEVKTRAIILTKAVKKTVIISMESGHVESLTSIFHTVGSLPGVEKLRVFNEEGIILYSARLDEIGKLTEELDYAIYRSPERAAPFQSADTGRRSFCMVEPIENQPQCYRCHDRTQEVLGVLDVCLSMEETLASIDRNKTTLYTSIFASVFITFVLIAGVFRQFVNRPIRDLVSAMARVEAGDLSIRVPIRSRDELGDLASSFNRMVERLDETQKELEKLHRRQLLRADRLASLGEMAAGLAHEIKNPLAGISGAIQVLVKEFSKEDPRREILSEVLALVERLDNTVRNLLNFARYTEPEFKLANINDVIDKVIFLARQIPEGRKATFIREFDPAMEEVEVDAEQIKQVFLNLFLNALQAKPEGCEITVKTYREAPPGYLKGISRKNYIMITVSDNGPGIPPDKLSKIFQPFFTTKEAGTGLGLSITRKILDLHEGHITVESEVGRGTSFHIFLPKRKL
ncbi:MAG: HAMP domain-containing protein [Deltaproteobacteria bacterium]|nr:MAG: HAMP domain-containing protein [Deltaproteobacteria bacterium]